MSLTLNIRILQTRCLSVCAFLWPFITCCRSICVCFICWGLHFWKQEKNPKKKIGQKFLCNLLCPPLNVGGKKTAVEGNMAILWMDLIEKTGGMGLGT